MRILVQAPFRQPAAPGGGDPVELGAPVVIRDAPFGAQQTAQLEPVQGGIERAFFHAQDLVGRLLDELGDGVAVPGTALEGLEDEHVERALYEVATEAWPVSHKYFM
jgi:hypothetical protein